MKSFTLNKKILNLDFYIKYNYFKNKIIKYNIKHI